MKKIITLSVLVVALLLGTTQAQAILPVKIGVRTGLNFSKFGGDLDDVKTRTGFLVGATVKVNVPLTGIFVQSGVDFTIKGAKQEVSEDGYYVKTNYSPMYLQVPIHLGYKIGLPGVGLSVSAGPYYAYGIGGKGKLTTNLPDQSNLKEDFFSKKGGKKSDFGIGAKVGVELVGLELSAGYDFGLTNISQNSDVKMKNKNAYITIGYNFF